jgi:hypothetical protein
VGLSGILAETRPFASRLVRSGAAPLQFVPVMVASILLVLSGLRFVTGMNAFFEGAEE